MMKTRHVDCPRSAIIVFRFVIIFGEVSEQASYADIAYAARVRLPIPRISRSSFAATGMSPPLCGEASRFWYCDRYRSFNLLSVRSFQFGSFRNPVLDLQSRHLQKISCGVDGTLDERSISKSPSSRRASSIIPNKSETDILLPTGLTKIPSPVDSITT